MSFFNKKMSNLLFCSCPLPECRRVPLAEKYDAVEQCQYPHTQNRKTSFAAEILYEPHIYRERIHRRPQCPLLDTPLDGEYHRAY